MLELLVILAFAAGVSLTVTLLWMAVEFLAPLLFQGQPGAVRFRVGLFWLCFALMFGAWIAGLWREAF